MSDQRAGADPNRRRWRCRMARGVNDLLRQRLAVGAGGHGSKRGPPYAAVTLGTMDEIWARTTQADSDVDGW
jgi:hypothetical protein